MLFDEGLGGAIEVPSIDPVPRSETESVVDIEAVAEQLVDNHADIEDLKDWHSRIEDPMKDKFNPHFREELVARLNKSMMMKLTAEQWMAALERAIELKTQ
ncbi:MAG TPA: hypothetical protein VEA18_03985 [Candidatus Kapabacteria bacterium]|nr:hypothetical protein [Candidatus Kapabacteria bacterium]